MPSPTEFTKSPENMKNIKVYLDKIYEELKEQYKSNTEITQRLQEILKFVRSGQTNLNVDTLIGSKADSKVLGIIFSVTFILDKIELYANKCNLSDMDKTFITKEKKETKDKKMNSKESESNKISKNTQDTYQIMNGLSKNMQAALKSNGCASSRLKHL